MIFKSRRAFEDAVQRRIYEEDERRNVYRRIDDLQEQIIKLRNELYEMRMKTDPEFRTRNTPTCGSDLATPANRCYL